MVIPARLFCKSIIVNLSSFDQFITIPMQEEEVKKKTISNVFRMWKNDSKGNIKTIIRHDLSNSFDASLFMKDPLDVLDAFDIIRNNFKMIQTVFMDMQAVTYLHHEHNFPEINHFVFMEFIMRVQDEHMIVSLPK